MLLLPSISIDRAVLRGSFLETDFASFIAWRDWGFPETGVRNCFAMGALRARDGAYLLGVMGPHTVNAGKIYFPAGVPDLDDVVGDKVDLARNVAREVAEETGLQPGDIRRRRRLGLRAHRAAPRHDEASDVRASRPTKCARASSRISRASRSPSLPTSASCADPPISIPMMPPFVTAFLEHMWSRTP